MKDKSRIIINIAIAAAVFSAWLSMFFGSGGTLSARGFTSLKFFTVLSNLFQGFVCLAWLVLRFSGRKESSLSLVLRLCSVSAVMLTFTVVVAFLGPLYGYPSMYRHSNFWFHLTVPLVSLAEFLVFNVCDFSKKEKAFTVIPVLIYGSVYLLNILLHDSTYKYDIYGFVHWGLPVGILIFAVICLVIYAEGLLICAGNRAFRRKFGKKG